MPNYVYTCCLSTIYTSSVLLTVGTHLGTVGTIIEKGDLRQIKVLNVNCQPCGHVREGRGRERVGGVGARY